VNTQVSNDFGAVEEKGDAFEFRYDAGKGAQCVLEAVIQTERGPKRTEMAVIPAALWRKVSVRAVRELVSGMGEEERTRKASTIKTGLTRLGPLLGRELAVLLWALMEEGADERVEVILHGWRELAREERWWLFSRGSAPGQGTGLGWRRALFHGLSEPMDSRSRKPAPAQKKSPQTSPLAETDGGTSLPVPSSPSKRPSGMVRSPKSVTPKEKQREKKVKISRTPKRPNKQKSPSN
jgi:hypothetical protein